MTTIYAHSSLSMPIPVVSSSDDYPSTSSSPPRIVRFENACVLIPDVDERQPRSPRIPMPMLVTKSYSLPLWKKRAVSPSPSKSRGGSNPISGLGTTGELDIVDEDVTVGAENREFEDRDNTTRVVLKVPIPLFRRRSSRSPTRHHSRSLSTSPIAPKKLPPPCLVHRGGDGVMPVSPILRPTKFNFNDASILPHSLAPLTLTPVRRPSLTSSHSSSSEVNNKRSSADITIPLRACCAACEQAMDESLREGVRWEEKFSRGARRRRKRSVSLDYGYPSAGEDGYAGSGYMGERHEMSMLGPSAQFGLISRALDDEGVSPTSPTLRASTSKFGLTVDEVDKRRKSLVVDLNMDLQFGAGILEEEEESVSAEDGQEIEVHGLNKDLEPFEAALPSPPGSPSFGNAPKNGMYASRFPRGPRVPQKQRSVSMPLPSSPHQQSSSSYFPPTTTTLPIQPPTPIFEAVQEADDDDDESMLFPLPTPSPRRSPSVSPRASPVPRRSVSASNESRSGSAASSPRGSPSPNGSRTSLGLGVGRNSPTSGFLEVRSVSGSGSRNSSQESLSLLRASLARRVVSASTSSAGGGVAGTSTSVGGGKLSQPQLSISTSPTSDAMVVGAGNSTTAEKRASATLIISPKGPRTMSLSGRRSSSSSSAPSSSTKSPSLSDPVTAAMEPSISSPTKQQLVPLRASATSTSLSSPSPPKSHSHSQAFPAVTGHPTSPSHAHAHSSNPTSTATSQPPTPNHHKQRKLSFTLPFIRAGEVLRGAGADMLKGVNSIGGGMGVGGV